MAVQASGHNRRARMAFNADERWSMLHLVKDPCVPTLEHVQLPCGNYHPPVRVYHKGRLLMGMDELKSRAHVQLVGGRRLPPVHGL